MVTLARAVVSIRRLGNQCWLPSPATNADDILQGKSAKVFRPVCERHTMRGHPLESDRAEDQQWIAWDSTDPLPELPQGRPGPASTESVPSGELHFWLDGDAVLCACPDCRAPMSVRLWLMVADCWRCGTSIALSEEDQRRVEALLDQQRGSDVTPESPSRRPADVPVTQPSTVAESLAGSESSPFDRQVRDTKQTAVRPVAAVAGTSAWLDRVFRDTPAWLISLIVHLILLTVLAMLRVEPHERRSILLSATVSPQLREGEQNILAPQQDELKFDLPLPENVDLTSDRTRKALLQAAEDARELQIDPDDPTVPLPDLTTVRQQLGEMGRIEAALAARDPRIRVEMVRREGGTTLTEAAVARGLRWLAAQQMPDGSWRLRGYDGRGGVESQAAATGLALMAFLGAGQTHLAGRYRAEVSRGLRWLIENQRPDGDLRADGDRQAGMYAHGQATIVLCEAFAMTGDERLREPAQRAVDFIVKAQYQDGGWRYTPEEPAAPRGGDTSVVGWQLMALQSARAARLAVPPYTLELADQFLDRVSFNQGSLYAYRPESRPTPAMTAEALLCRIYLGWRQDNPALRDGIHYLVEQHLADPNDWNIYYWYYATQTLHHYGGEPWETWNRRIRDVLVFSQEKQGKHAGSWPPRGAWADAGGRLFVTSLAVCTLEVYYRHLPLFRPLGEPSHR
ncbi:MAG: hypothetical protein KatS3mg109_1516 [Pirellulaceae bacterium]|nr:MAG: hypothetical protein KatS3mg109_1516 [Pirellulaceae bacterium]